MKSFKRHVSEVAEPRSQEEKKFKDQHTVKVSNHPVAEPHQHTGDIKKPKAKRKADQEGDANYDVAYESVEESVEELDEISKDLAARYIKKAQVSTADAGMNTASSDKEVRKRGINTFLKRRKGVDSAVKRLTKEAKEDDMPASPDESSMAAKQTDFIQYVGREVAEHIKAGKEFPEWMQNKLSAVHQAAKDLHATLGGHGGDDMDEELSPAQKKIDKNKNGKIDGHDLAMLRSKKKNEEVELDETTVSAIKRPVNVTGPDGKTRTVMRKARADKTDDHGQDKIHANESVEQIDEAFKQGIVKLKDGSSTVLKKEDAEALNKMFKKMSAASKKKMTETAMKDKKGFAEILEFAKEAN